jgi:hypothetical protein
MTDQPKPPLEYESRRSVPSLLDWADMFVRVLGLYFVVSGCQAMLFFIGPALIDGMPWAFVASGAGGGVAELAAGAAMILAGRRVAQLLVGSMADVPAPVPAAPGRQLQAVAFSVCGVIAAIRGILGMVAAAGSLLEDDSQPDLGRNLATVAPPVVEVLLGVFLFFQARGLALFWHRIRSQAREDGRRDGGDGPL